MLASVVQDGALDFDDFMSLYVTQLKDGPNNEAEMLEAFQAFDKAGNGFIVVDDLKQVRAQPAMPSSGHHMLSSSAPVRFGGS